jgi:AcrR family transcriptional regulator
MTLKALRANRPNEQAAKRPSQSAGGNRDRAGDGCATPKRQRGRPKDGALSARRTEEILDVAARLFASRGFPNTDVQTVADELRVGKGTVYRYFPTKKDLFLAAVDRGMRKLTAHIDAAMNAADPLEQIGQGIRAYLSFFKANPELAELLIQERAEFKDRPRSTYFIYRDANINKHQTLINGLIAAGRIRALPFDMISAVIGDLLYGTMFTDYFSGRQRSPDEQVEAILQVVMGGLLTDAEKTRQQETRTCRADASLSKPRRKRDGDLER